MSFGFSGASRSGKTTLAVGVSKNLGIHYYDGSPTRILKRIGLNPVANLKLFERLLLQERLLKMYEAELRELPRPFITDRTPLDMIGYMLGEVTMHNCEAELGDAIQSYVEKCLQVTSNNFDMVIFTRPLNFYAADPTKPPPNAAYQWLTQYIMEGAGDQINQIVLTGATKSSNSVERLNAACEVIVERMDEMSKKRKLAILH